MNKWKASEMKAIAIILPPLVYEYVNENMVKLLNTFRRLVLFIFNKNISRSENAVLRSLEDTFIKQFYKAFGQYSVTQKVHRVTHFHSAIHQLGQVKNTTCFPFEGYLSFLAHGTHCSNDNLMELVFLSTLNSNLATYIDAYCDEKEIFGKNSHSKVCISFFLVLFCVCAINIYVFV
jgi:hypothetical protein